MSFSSFYDIRLEAVGDDTPRRDDSYHVVRYNEALTI